MPSLLDSTPQIPAAGAWGSLYAVQEPVKPRHVMVVPATAVANKKPAYYGGRKKNLETCTEALGCETGAIDAAPPACNDGADDKGDVEVEEAAEYAERKRRAREEMEEGRARRPLPPPLTTLAGGGASRVRMVPERRDGRLAVYAVRTPGVEAERSGGRLRMRLVSLPSTSTIACRRQEPPEAAEAKEEVVEEVECGVAKYLRGGRCAEPECAAAAARRRKQWEQEQAAASFWVATS